MRYVTRLLSDELQKAVKQFPVVLLTGPRRAGKTCLLKHLYPKADYRLLEDHDILGRVRADPRAFLDEVRVPAVLDEIQNAPELLNYLRSRVDREPGRKGRWLLTGSQEAALMRGVSESMAGRAGLLHLLPFSLRECPKVRLTKGGFPEALGSSSAASRWFSSYVQTYLERDVRAVTSIRDLATFRRFMALLATRSGQTLNRSDLAGPMGVSVPTISEWLSILETTGQIVLVPPFYENFGKRIVKSPKLYFVDSGLLCHLLALESERHLVRSPFLGPVFEGFVASEVLKHQLNSGRRRQLYFFRDRRGLEVDFVVPCGGAKLLLVEAKATRTVKPVMAEPLIRLSAEMKSYSVKRVVVHRSARQTVDTTALKPGVSAVPVEKLTDWL